MTWVAAGAVALTLLVLLALGWRPVVLLSNSMAPGAPSGSLLLARPVAPESVVANDVVTVETGGGRVTHRVLAVEEIDGERWARLQGDANATPDPGRVRLPTPTLRTVAVVPQLGGVLIGEGRLVLVGLGLLALGVGALGALRAADHRDRAASHDPQEQHEPHEPREAHEPQQPRGAPASDEQPPDPRVVVLAATLDALAEDGMARSHLRALARVRTAALLGLGDVEADVSEVDPGVRFVLVALADADPAALGLVGPDDARAVAAHAAVAAWWAEREGDVPASVRAELDGVLVDAGAQAGVTAAGPVD